MGYTQDSSDDKLTKELLQLVESGKGYEEIKKVVAQKGLSQEALRQQMRYIDHHLQLQEQEEAHHRTALEWLLVGGIITLISLVMMIYGWMYPEGYYIYLPLAGFVGGISILVSGWRFKQSISSDSDSN